MRNPFLRLDEFYGRPFPTRTSATAEGLFMDETPRLTTPSSPFTTPFEPSAPQEPIVRKVAPPVQRTSETAEGLYMQSGDETSGFGGFPFLGGIGIPGLIPLMVELFMNKREKKRSSEGTIKKEEKKEGSK